MTVDIPDIRARAGHAFNAGNMDYECFLDVIALCRTVEALRDSLSAIIKQGPGGALEALARDALQRSMAYAVLEDDIPEDS